MILCSVRGCFCAPDSLTTKVYTKDESTHLYRYQKQGGPMHRLTKRTQHCKPFVDHVQEVPVATSLPYDPYPSTADHILHRCSDHREVSCLPALQGGARSVLELQAERIAPVGTHSGIIKLVPDALGKLIYNATRLSAWFWPCYWM